MKSTNIKDLKIESASRGIRKNGKHMRKHIIDIIAVLIYIGVWMGASIAFWLSI